MANCKIDGITNTTPLMLRIQQLKRRCALGGENLEKEQRISELRNQAGRLGKTKKDEIMKSYSPAALVDKPQSPMVKLDEESEELHQKFLEKDMDLASYLCAQVQEAPRCPSQMRAAPSLWQGLTLLMLSAVVVSRNFLVLRYRGCVWPTCPVLTGCMHV
ncbi:hypothetical protein BRADI_1g21840v3 [Brachypodium distachyon]|uniref:VPS37 C-terminal domain-containing protein n=1 Tax=Brachypodium distachyon TaxID=15368 RepID=I1GSH3_BRADI|nr:hypothetical protein BRADI_1g21840v3 [Brachypodium distachyon]